tara:strand:- start:16641 stop:17138 length:498 start_codon:yes stop_codon:yes gene_type:complete
MFVKTIDMRFLLLAALIGLFGCSTEMEFQPASPEQIKKTINTSLDDWHLNAANAKFKPYFDLFSPNGIYIGTDQKEIWTVEEFKTFSKPYFDKGKAWSFEATDRNIYISRSKQVVWFDELLSTWMGTCRGSGVFQYNDSKWELEHYVLSLTVPNEKMDSVIQTIE